MAHLLIEQENILFPSKLIFDNKNDEFGEVFFSSDYANDNVNRVMLDILSKRFMINEMPLYDGGRLSSLELPSVAALTWETHRYLG